MNWIRRQFDELTWWQLGLLAFLAGAAVTSIIIFRRFEGLGFLILGFGGLRLASGTGPRTITWNPPSVMRVGQTKNICVAIGSAEALEAAREAVGSESASLTTDLPSQLLVRLVFDEADFSILAINNEPQHLLQDEPTTWEFKVTPKRHGKWPLTLRVTMIFDAKNGSQRDLLFKQEIDVEAELLRAIGLLLIQYWPKMVGTLLVTALGAVLAYLGLKS